MVLAAERQRAKLVRWGEKKGEKLVGAAKRERARVRREREALQSRGGLCKSRTTGTSPRTRVPLTTSRCHRPREWQPVRLPAALAVGPPIGKAPRMPQRPPLQSLSLARRRL
jgi:hypothetical protein